MRIGRSEMNPDYPDKLRDLGLTEHQIEAILDLNDEAIYGAEDHADTQVELQSDSIDDLNKAHYEFRLHYLQTERFIY